MSCDRKIGPFDCCSVFQGDCLELMKSLPDGCVDAVVTDPPYSGDVHSKQWISAALTAAGAPRVSSQHRAIGFACITDEIRRSAALDFARVANYWTLAFSDIESTFNWRSAFESAGLDYVRTCIWDKVDSSPQFTGDRPASAAEAIICAHPKGRKTWNGGGRRNVFTVAVNGSQPGNKPHPTTKPLSLMVELCALFTSESQTILDPFCGSGTTLVAAKKLGRHFLGFEISPEYCDIARERLARIDAQPNLFTPKPEQLTL
jgi:DNA modification methylase